MAQLPASFICGKYRRVCNFYPNPSPPLKTLHFGPVVFNRLIGCRLAKTTLVVVCAKLNLRFCAELLLSYSVRVMCWTFSVPVWGRMLNSRSPCRTEGCVQYCSVSMLFGILNCPCSSNVLCNELMLSPCWFLCWTVATPTLSRVLNSWVLMCCTAAVPALLNSEQLLT